MIDFLYQATDLFEYTRSMRRDFHRHPELGFQEVRTAGIVAHELNALGLEVTAGIGQTGVVAMLEGGKPGPVLLLRFDMDALPITEETGAEYASQTPGVMHACGHDGHVAVGLTVARMLVEHRADLAGSIKLVFQPAEEGMGGAEQMIADGVLQNPEPAACLALHVWNERPLGWLGIADGPVMAAAESFNLRVTGKGGHGAAPHFAIDPVLAAAQVIAALQGIVARNVSPLATAVVSVTTIHGGDAFNVIPSTVDMKGTIRTFEPKVRERVLARFEQVVHRVAEAGECQVDIDVKSITPAVVNDPQISARVRQVAGQVLPESVVDLHDQTMGSEDMAFMMQQVPGTYIFVGSADPATGKTFSHHHPRFDFDEQALLQASALMAAAAADYLRG